RPCSVSLPTIGGCWRRGGMGRRGAGSPSTAAPHAAGDDSMSAQDMTVSELLGATEILLPTSPVGATLRGHEVFSPFVGLFDEARDVLAAAPPETSELGRITAELETVDADHDREIRFIVGFLLAFNYYWKPELRTEAQRIRQALFSEGTSLVNRSLSHEAGAVAT